MTAIDQDVEKIRKSFAGIVEVAEAGDADGYRRYITDEMIHLGPGAPAVICSRTVNCLWKIRGIPHKRTD